MRVRENECVIAREMGSRPAALEATVGWSPAFLQDFMILWDGELRVKLG
jgi:hypothetical protein